MIVIAMMAILIGSGIFPYAYYMDRARVEKTIDTISQEWIIAHQKIKWWFIHPWTNSHANLYIEIEKWASNITFSTATGNTWERVIYKKYDFDDNIRILDFSGSIEPSTTNLIYHISPPFATWAFSTGSLWDEFSLSGIIVTIGYPGSTHESYRTRDILLRPYFD